MHAITHNGFKFDAQYSARYHVPALDGELKLNVHTEIVTLGGGNLDQLELCSFVSLRLPYIGGLFVVHSRIVDINRAAIAMRHAAATLRKQKDENQWRFLPAFKLLCLAGMHNGSVFDSFAGACFIPDAHGAARIDNLDCARLMEVYARYDINRTDGRSFLTFTEAVEKVMYNSRASSPVAYGENPFLG